MKGPAYHLDRIEVPIAVLLKRGYNGGFLIIYDTNTNYFLQFSKYISKPNDYGIEFCFPNTTWSSKFFYELIELCKHERMCYYISKKEDNTKDSIEFLNIDFGRDVKSAYNFSRKILLDIFKLDETTKLFIRLENATTENVLIDK